MTERTPGGRAQFPPLARSRDWSSPLNELPNLRLTANRLADLGEKSHRALQFAHRFLFAPGTMKQIRQVVVQRSLAMTIDDRGGGLQRGSSQLDRALEITRTSVGEREVVQRGDTSSRIVDPLGDRETL